MTRIVPNSRMAWEMSLLFGGICLLCVGLLYIFKVGLTTRKTITRRAELNRNSGHHMKIVATVSLPWARVCEARVLKGLSGSCADQADSTSQTVLVQWR